MLDQIPGFSTGYSASSGGTLSGFQRVARMRGDPEPTRIEGTRGSGRADRARSYTIKVTRVSDGKALERTIGPAYRSKKVWKALARAAQQDLVKELS